MNASSHFCSTLRRLAPLARAFPLHAKEARLRPLFDPPEFHRTLVAAISRAKGRISLCALYLGTGDLEKELVACIDKTLSVRPAVRVRLVFDGSRARRKSRISGISTLSLLLPLLRKHGPDRLSLHLCSMPAAQKAEGLPPMLGEIAGVFHAKAYVVDNELIISGANLSDEYFRNRQDRYLHIGKGPEIADWYHNMIKTLGDCGKTVTIPSQINSKFEFTTKSPKCPVREWRKALESLVKPVNTTIGLAESLPFPNEGKPPDTYIFPTIQCGPIGMDHDTTVLDAVLDSVPVHGSVRLATAYLNPPSRFVEKLAAAAPYGEVSILTAHRDSHGFRGAKGLMSYVVDCYMRIESDLRPLFRSARTTLSSKDLVPCPLYIGAYRRPGWTYHAKGLWIRASHKVPCFLSVAGSSNFGRRSFDRDLETQMVILSNEPNLRYAFEEEWSRLSRFINDSTSSSCNDTATLDSATRSNKNTRPLARLLSVIFGGFL